MKRTTIMLPLDLKQRAAKAARKRGVSLGEFIRESLQQVCNDSKEASSIFYEDSHFYTNETPPKVAENHDDYLY